MVRVVRNREQRRGGSGRHAVSVSLPDVLSAKGQLCRLFRRRWGCQGVWLWCQRTKIYITNRNQSLAVTHYVLSAPTLSLHRQFMCLIWNVHISPSKKNKGCNFVDYLWCVSVTQTRYTSCNFQLSNKELTGFSALQLASCTYLGKLTYLSFSLFTGNNIGVHMTYHKRLYT